jgi:hypothetical protein
MAKIYDVHSVIVDAAAPNLNAHCYTEIYGGQAGCTIVVNGTSILIGPSSSIFIGINSVSGGSGCYLLGSKKDVFEGSTDYL